MKIYYTSGSLATDEFEEIRKSIGGFQTNLEVSGGLNQLFGTVSLRMISEELSDYRCVIIENDTQNDYSNLNIYTDTPQVASQKDPDNLSSVNEGDQYIVPQDAEGDWIGLDGKWVIYNGSSWDVKFRPFALFRYGFVSVDNITDGNIQGSAVRKSEDIFSRPSGVDFFSADGSASAVTIGDGNLAAGEKIAVWIERQVKSFEPVSDDFSDNEGAIEQVDEIDIVFEYDE